jgi:hypothetical protein
MTNINNHQHQEHKDNRPSALVVLPVYNEEKALQKGVLTLRPF